MGRRFVTDGARGVANTEISCTLAMDIGRAAAMVVARDRAVKRPVFLLGHDTRISHGMLCSALAAGLCSVGADVITLGKMCIRDSCMGCLIRCRSIGCGWISRNVSTVENVSRCAEWIFPSGKSPTASSVSDAAPAKPAARREQSTVVWRDFCLLYTSILFLHRVVAVTGFDRHPAHLTQLTQALRSKELL